MRTLALVFVLLLGVPVFSAPAAHAQSGLEVPQTGSVDEVRGIIRGALNQSRQFLGGLLTETKNASGLNDEQLFGVGVGLLAGLLAANVVGTGGFGNLVLVTAGALVGRWATTPATK